MRLLLEAPINSLSFGQVSYNLYRAFLKLGIDVHLMPIGGQLDLSSFDTTTQEDFDKVLKSIDDGRKFYDGKAKALKLWHLNGSESNPTNDTSLFTFYELDSPTDYEVAIAKRQSNIIFSSSSSAQLFKDRGVVDATNCHVGFDPDLKVTSKKHVGAVHWGLMGKFEKRKHTAKIIQMWLARYGNNPKHKLTACVVNPFMDREALLQILNKITDNGKYKNIQFLEFMPQNSLVNDFINSLDIDISGLGTEGWGLPSFNATALGKWSVVINGSAQKDWATKDNSILVQPSKKIPCYDGIFFAEGQFFNQGNILDFEAMDLMRAFEIAESKVGTINEEGLKLQEQFSYEKMAENLINIIK